MAEETEGQDIGAEAAAGGIDPAAMALALGGASREKADAFLDDQRALIADQRRLTGEQFHHLREQFKQLRLNIWQQRMGVLLRIATAAVGIVVAGAFALMVWDASRSNGMLIEPFSVPPDLGARGVTGEVMAAKLLDHLSQMDGETASVRPPNSYATSWTQQDLKIDIPETGLSLNQLDNFLHEKLGHDTHVTGELVRDGARLSLTARVGIQGAETVDGQDSELDSLIARLSEAIYRRTQPYRYGVWLSNHDRLTESLPVFQALANSGPASERAWGYVGLSTVSTDSEGANHAYDLVQHAVAMAPESFIAWTNLAFSEEDKGLAEQVLHDEQKAVSLLSGSGAEELQAAQIPVARLMTQADIDASLGAYHDAMQDWETYFNIGTLSGRPNLTAGYANTETGGHDLRAARATLAQPLTEAKKGPGLRALMRLQAQLVIEQEAQDWNGLLTSAKSVAPLLAQYPGLRTYQPSLIAPLIAVAHAKLGQFHEAEAAISPTPADCYPCLVARARIAELQGQRERAAWWFNRAAVAGPSLPFAFNEEGNALLGRGSPDQAISYFSIANNKSPHFADPLEMWGEALMAKNRSDLALAKFAEAEKYAPNWGRLHLKWGEALGYVGRKDEAQKQYARAAGLDLSEVDKAELARVSHV